MLDFLIVSARSTKKDVLEIYPKFVIKKSEDLMIRGRDFYAIWDASQGLWSTEEDTVTKLVDNELDKVASEKRQSYDGTVKVLYMWDSDSGSMSRFHQYVQKHMRDNYKPLDESLTFSDTKTTREHYASKRLPYALVKGNHDAWDELVGTLYSKEERDKLEWAIGAIVSGDSKKIQKFIVMYGEGGTGKSTIINIVEKLFAGYTSTFDAKALGSSGSRFALEPFKTNPLVAIQHDGDLSRIEDNTRLNSVVSHEIMSVDEKYKGLYDTQFNAFLFMGTNRPVKITDAKSGIIRRLIDVSPTGKKIPRRRYNELVTTINFELGAIAEYCLGSYKRDPGRFDDYVPSNMLSYSNDFYNFIIDNFDRFKDSDGVLLDSAYALYIEYCESSKISYPFSKRVFKSEFSNYFEEYHDRYGDSKKVFTGFLKDKFVTKKKEEPETESTWLTLKEQDSIFDKIYASAPAQLAINMVSWSVVKTILSDIDTHDIHYVRVPKNHIVIDFDIKNESGEKDLDANIKEASKWPKTYAEVSKSGGGLHLHYIYKGDPELLKREFAPNIEIKVFAGKASLRRKLTLCNSLPISDLSSGLPLKEVKKNVINFDAVKDEMHLRNLINKGLNKQVHAGTKPNIDFIFKILNDAYESGMKYDVSDLRPYILNFAINSTNQARYCVNLVNQMMYKSEDSIDNGSDSDEYVLTFFDCEVLPNFFGIVYKPQGGKCVRLKQPTPEMIEPLFKMKLVGFNCRKYDNHILYAAWQGYNNKELFELSKKIIVEKSRNAFFGNAYNISYTDIYDFSSKKQSLKKWEIELGINHQELGMKWDEPVPEDKWDLVMDYCENDVIATEAVFNHLHADFQARLILADIAGMNPNTTTNSLTTKIIFGNRRDPQAEFNYRDLSKPVRWSKDLQYRFGEDYVFHVFDENGEPTYQIYDNTMELPDGWSVLPFFPGYKYECGVSTYLDELVGEGGRVYAEPGFYGNVGLSDVASMHPHSIISEMLFGPIYTKRFKDIVEGRIAIKHKDWERLSGMLDGAFSRHLEGDINPKDLAYALKIAINSVYGLTSARFDNKFRDLRNIDNIVAKRGALFMTKLKAKVQSMGYQVAHIKTDSIKIPDATPEIIKFIEKYGHEFGYSFEHEATYEKMCLVNDAVYIAKFAKSETCEQMYGYIPEDNAEKGGKWSATGAQFKDPYVFKTLFSHEGVEFKDLCVTNAVQTNLYLDFNEKLYLKLLSEYGIILENSYILDDEDMKNLLKSVGIKKKDAGEMLLDETLHDLRFIGKVGSFVPIKPGCGGGLLLRENDSGGFGAATGSKGYRWMEAEEVKKKGFTDLIDMRYFEKFVDDAKKAISEYCDFTWFASDDPYNGEIPFVN